MKDVKRTLLVHVGLGQSGSTSMFSIFDDIQFGYELITPRDTREEVMFSLFEGLGSGCFDKKTFKEYVSSAVSKCPMDRTPVISSEGLTRTGFFQNNLNLECEAYAYRLREALPEYDIKILLVVREQRSLFVSKYRKYVEKFGGNIALGKFIRTSCSRQYVPIDREHLYAGNFNYANLHRLYISIFGKENVQTLPMEMMKHNPSRFLGEISNLVKKKNNINLPIPRLNSHGKIGLTKFIRFFNLIYSPLSPSLFGFINSYYIPDINYIAQNYTMQIKVYFKIRNIFARILSGFKYRDFLEKERFMQKKELDKVLGDFYENNNSELSELTSVEYKEYGYRVLNNLS